MNKGYMIKIKTVGSDKDGYATAAITGKNEEKVTTVLLLLREEAAIKIRDEYLSRSEIVSAEIVPFIF